jgi:hypothetical protein
MILIAAEIFVIITLKLLIMLVAAAHIKTILLTFAI